MKTCRLILYLILFVILNFGLLTQNQPMEAATASGKNDKKVVFQWAFCALRKANAGKGVEVINRDTALKSGDQISFFIKLESRSFFYLIY
jgi:hypothetical protein